MPWALYTVNMRGYVGILPTRVYTMTILIWSPQIAHVPPYLGNLSIRPHSK